MSRASAERADPRTSSSTISSVTLVFVLWDRAPFVADAIDRLRGEASTVSTEAIVVDNGGIWQESVPGAILDHPDHNLGFAAAVNRAVERTGGDAILLINPDLLPDTGCLRAALAELRRHDGRAIVGCHTRFADGAPNPTSGGRYPDVGAMWSLLRGARRPRRDGDGTVDFVSGCFLLTTRAVWDALGGFDESFFCYGEDADLSRRAEAIGVVRRLAPGASAIHTGGFIPREDALRTSMYRAGVVRFSRKHHGRLRATVVRLLIDAWHARRVLVRRLALRRRTSTGTPGS